MYDILIILVDFCSNFLWFWLIFWQTDPDPQQWFIYSSENILKFIFISLSIPFVFCMSVHRQYMFLFFLHLPIFWCFFISFFYVFSFTYVCIFFTFSLLRMYVFFLFFFFTYVCIFFTFSFNVCMYFFFNVRSFTYIFLFFLIRVGSSRHFYNNF